MAAAYPALQALAFILLASLTNSPVHADPDPVHDFCVATGKDLTCKDKKWVTPEDFSSQILRGITSRQGGLGASMANVHSFPALNTLGLSIARVDIEVGTVVVAHIHMRASEVMYVDQGTVESGFVDGNNTLYVQTMHKGDLFVIPRGVIHYQYNVGNTPATFFAIWNSQDPGFQDLGPASFASGIRNEERNSRARVVICPYWGIGHVTPMLMLARRLVRLGLSITFLMPGQQLYARALSDTEALDIVFEVVEFEQEEAGGVERIVSSGLRQVKQDIKDYLLVYEDVFSNLKRIRLKLEELKLSYPILGAVLDPFMFYKGIVVDNIGIPIYAFLPFSATSVVCFRYLLFNGLSPDATSLSVPGLPLLHRHDIVETILSSSEHPRAQLHASRNKWMQECCQGVLLNSWEGIEEGPISALRDPNVSYLPKALAEAVFPIGPLLPPSYLNEESVTSENTFFKSPEEAHCKEWLDTQKPSSVLFVCFGSWLELDDEQMYELAMGLEASALPFLWVLKSDKFPWWQGFVERTKAHGIVLVGWAPQQNILRHDAVGGFVMTCGWNSVNESIALSSQGIALVAWPLYLDHMPTCRLLVDVLKIAAEVHGSEGAHEGLVNREEVARVAKLVMLGPEADAMRSRAAKLKSLAHSSVAKGGSSHLQLQAFVEKCTRSRLAAP